MFEGNRRSIKWRHIEDLPPDWKQLAAPDVAALGTVWVEQADRLKGSSSLKDFNEQLGREWSIETGIIENIYSIDRGITTLLIERGIETSLIPHGTTDKPAQYIVDVLRDHEQVLEGLFEFVGNAQPLSVFYIRQLHAALCRSQHTTIAKDQFGGLYEVPLLGGEWKKQPNNPQREDGSIHEYCPPEHVASEMDRLIELHLMHDKLGVPPEVEAAWLHHRFSQIHPFQDGNGRVVRALASIILLRAKWFPLVIDRDVRAEYISSLETADRGDLAPLVQLFSKNMKSAFIKALSTAAEVLSPEQSYRQVIGSAVDILKKRDVANTSAQGNVFELSKVLEDATETRLRAVQTELEQALRGYNGACHVESTRGSADDNGLFRFQVAEQAKSFGYFADTSTYHRWILLRIFEKSATNLIISFHSLGREFVGVLVATATIEFRLLDSNSREEEQNPSGIRKPACREAFEFSYLENQSDLTTRFNSWLDEVLLIALNEWRNQL